MPFGLCSAAEEFQKRMIEAIDGLEGTFAIADDIMIVGKGNNTHEASKDHYINVEKLLQRMKERKIELNKENIQYK